MSSIFRESLPSRGHNIWMSDRYVSVHADGHQVKDEGGAGPDQVQPNKADCPNTQLSTTSLTAEKRRTKTPKTLLCKIL